MDATVSVSKGVFLFRNGSQKSKNTKKKSKYNLFEKMFTKEPWYIAYKNNMNVIESQLEHLHQKTYSKLLSDIVEYMKSLDCGHEDSSVEGVIPSVTVLTGVNQPDHVKQFGALVNIISADISPHVAMVSSQDAHTVKHMVENVVWQLINGTCSYDLLENNEESGFELQKKFKKSRCTMRVLQNWYIDKYVNSPRKRNQVNVKKCLIVIMPDFESLNSNVLQDFVLIASSYISLLPLIFVFGVATSVSALHKSFPYHVSSKLLIKVFHSNSSHAYMNEVLDHIFLTHTSPFHLLGKPFELLTDVFLFYDFSVTGFIQNIKYCFMEHFYGDNSKALCCERDKIGEAIASLTDEDLESIRQLPSFRPFLERQDCQTKIDLFNDDNFFRKILFKEINKLHDYMHSFYVCVRLLLVFVKDIPKNIIGKSIREIYAKCVTESITETAEFKECMQLIHFQSQLKLIESLNNAVKVITTSLQTTLPVQPLRSTSIKNSKKNVTLDDDQFGERFLKNVKVHLIIFLRQIENANNDATTCTSMDTEEDHDVSVPGNRYKLKEKLLRATRTDRVQSEFEMIRARFVEYLAGALRRALRPPQSRAFHELVVFGGAARVRARVAGAPRGAVHAALARPARYLQCSCCRLASAESATTSVPDTCLAYALHRECGKHINLYDWLQAFGAVLQPQLDDDARFHDSGVQVRFTRAVAELQFLGFIKSSKRKTDHVMRLTW